MPIFNQDIVLAIPKHMRKNSVSSADAQSHKTLALLLKLIYLSFLTSTWLAAATAAVTAAPTELPVDNLVKQQPLVDHSQIKKAPLLLHGQASTVYTYNRMGFHSKQINGKETIDQVKPGSPAAIQGLQVGDRITLKRENPTQTYLEILRDNHSYAATLTLGGHAPIVANAVSNISAPSFASAGKATAAIQTWHNPQVYKAIAQSGETIVSERVVTVPAYCPCTSSAARSGRTTANPWTAANIAVQPGQRLWLDTDAGTRWEWTHGASCDANGLGSDCGGISCLFKKSAEIPASTCALIAYVGRSQPPGSQPGQIVWNATFYSDPAAFAAGNYKIDYTPRGSGQVYFVANDNALGDNAGFMRVRVIVTKPTK